MVKQGINSDPYYNVTEFAFYSVTVSLLAYYSPILITIFVLVPLGFKVYAKLSVGVCTSYKRLDGKTVIVTGANIGIGLETAKDLAKRGARVILACRSLERGKAALEEVKQDSRNENVVLKELDLASLASVRKFCKEIVAEESRLDILINNAGIPMTKQESTKDGMELCIQTNHFAPFLLTHLLLDLLKKSGNARIVNVSSDAHRHVKVFDPENLNSEKSFTTLQAYKLSKLANIYFTRELNRRLKDAGIKEIKVNSLHPGVVKTAFGATLNEVWYWRIITFSLGLFAKTTVEGAQTSIHVAVSEEVEGMSGEYFVDCQKSRASNLGENDENAQILWEKSVKLVGLKPNETIVPI